MRHSDKQYGQKDHEDVMNWMKSPRADEDDGALCRPLPSSVKIRFYSVGKLVIWLCIISSISISAASFVPEISILLTENTVPYRGNDSFQRENGNHSILALKMAAVQADIDKLIQAVAKQDDPHVSNILPPSAAGSLTPPNQNDRITQLENEVKKMKEELGKLKESSNLSSDERARIEILETSVKLLEQLLDNQRRDFNQKFDKLESLIQELIQKINDLEAEMKRRAREQDEARRLQGLPAECVMAIKSQDFGTAERKLQEINDDKKINFIVREVYDYRQSNFELVLRFGNSLSSKQRSFLVFKALNYEMESNGHRDPLQMIKLIDSLRAGIIGQQTATTQLKQQAQSLEDDLKRSIKAVSKEKLKNGMLNNAYVSNNEIKTLSNQIYRISDQLFADLLTEVVNEVYQRMDIKILLQCIRSHSYIQQWVPGYAAVFYKIRYWSHDAIFDIAYFVKAASSNAELNNGYKSTLNQIKNSLPRSVRNAVFASKVCIENRKYPKNLYASGKYLHDKPRRNVYAWMDGNRDVRHQEDHWQLFRNNDNFFIFNVAHREYMYSPSEYKDFKEGNDRRKVFTWTEGNAFDSCRWYLEPIGDDVYIKSVVRSEYLYASRTYLHKKTNEKVFTWIPGGPVGNGVWSIHDCSNA